MTDSEIGRIIREQRLKLGLSQQQLAKKVGVTWEMVSRYERGKSSALQKIFELAEALEVEVNRFFGATGNGFPKFRDASSEYLTSRFIPVITVVPSSATELIEVLAGTETGLRLFDNGEQVEKFGIRLGTDSKVRIASGALLPKGVLICSLALGDLSEHSVVVVARNGLVSVEQYVQGDVKAVVLAKVTEWVVKL
jgi:transcriptional regulator with XRE-family HTH domain